MRESTDICLRTTRSSIVRPVRVSPSRRPSSAIPRLSELKVYPDNENRKSSIDNSSIALSGPTMSVYLRLKPQLTKSKRIKKVQNDTYAVLNQQNLLTKFPSLEGSTSFAKKSKSLEMTSRKFNFTTILGPESTQSEFFEKTMKQQILDFLGGQSATIMTYGTTNSGKSHTLYGNPETPGIIPRSIELVFSGVNCTLSPWYKPTNVCEVVSLDETSRCQEIEARNHFFSLRLADTIASEDAYVTLKNSKLDARDCDDNGEAMYSIWLSFVEIYNENFYDLLIDDETQLKVAPLKLIKDKNGRAFVQGLRTICATTGLDAYRIMMIGRSRLTIGLTGLNPQSSRSHSIFTIKLLKYVKENVPTEVKVSTMTFCDLAGTGRTRKSGSAGSELKEAKNINTSLLVLGRCLKVVSDCQASRQNIGVVGPFRDSKLTRLFQRGILGKEPLCLVVNIDTSPDLYVETHAVLQFASIAKKIVIEPGSDDKPSLVSQITISSPKNSARRESVRPTRIALVETNEKQPEVAIKSDIEKLKERNVSLTKEITILREAALNREYEIRQEMANLYAGIIKDVEANWQKRTRDVEEEQDDLLKWSVKQIEQFYKERIDSLTNRKRRRTSGGDERDDRNDLCEQLEAENSQITGKVVALRQMVKKLKNEQEILSADKNKCVFELSLAKDTLKQVRRLLDEEMRDDVTIIDNDGKNIIDDLSHLIDEKNKIIKSLKKSLHDAKCLNVIKGTSEKSTDKTDETKNTSILETSKTELDNGMRTRRIRDDKRTIDVKVLEETIEVIEEKEIDARFSSLTFRKESNDMFLPSSTRYSVIEAENSNLDNVTTCTIDSTISSKYSLTNDELTKNLRLNFFGTIDKVCRSSVKMTESSKQDDSGIAGSPENSLTSQVIKEDKSCQTNRFEDTEKNDRINEIIQERVERLKFDHTKLVAEHLHENIRVNELSLELESIQRDVTELKESARQNEMKILDYQDQLSSRDKDLSNLEALKRANEMRLSELLQQMEKRAIDYEKKIVELRDELSIEKDRENRASKHLSEYKEKSFSLENQLSLVQAQIDKNSIRCLTEHVSRIEKLEDELSTRTRRVHELDEKLLKYENDVERVSKLNERVMVFEKIFDDKQREKEELRRQLLERMETQLSLECRVKRLTGKVHERENEISALRTDLGNVVKMNMENSERARELSKEIAVAHARLASVRGEMTRSEEERRKLERTSGHEIGNLIARLADFEKNATILSRMRDNEDSRIDDLDRFKLLLHEKEREMCLLKKNRDKTIRRYETLIRKLQADVEMRCNRESSKLRMLYPKRSISKESLRSMAESFRWKATLRQSVDRVKSSQGIVDARKRHRWQSSDRSGQKCSRSYPTCSTIIKHSSSQALVASSTSLEGSRSSGSKNVPLRYDDDDDDDDEECARHELIEIESRTELNLDMIECHRCGRRDGLSQAPATFSIPSTSDESFADFRDMEIRRTNGRTHFRLRKGDSSIVSEDHPADHNLDNGDRTLGGSLLTPATITALPVDQFTI